MNEEWMYYKHAICSKKIVRENSDLDFLKRKDIWSRKAWGGGIPVLARWISDWDLGMATEFWYIIKDNKFDIASLKAKRRYEINKGKRNFDVSLIDPTQYIDQLLYVQEEALKSYPLKYRPKNIDYNQYISELHSKWDFIYGAFLRETGELVGYAFLNDQKDFVEFQVLKVIPSYEKLGVNAAIIVKILEDLEGRFDGKFYIVDGARNISHETKFQDYLEKYFGFRKAYCKLNIKYRPSIIPIVKILYPIRKQLKKFDRNSMIHQVNGVLFMEEIARKCNKKR